MSQSITPEKMLDFNTHTVEALREHCKLISLPTTGNKADLVSLLMDHYKKQAEYKLEDLFTNGVRPDDASGMNLGQQVASMFEMIMSTQKQKMDARETETKQKKTVTKMHGIVTGGITSHSKDIDNVNNGQSSAANFINELHQAIEDMENRLCPEDGALVKDEDPWWRDLWSESAEADASVRRFVDAELAEYAEYDIKVLEDLRIDKDREPKDYERVLYRKRMRDERRAEAEQNARELGDQASEVAANAQPDIIAVMDLEAGLKADVEQQAGEVAVQDDLAAQLEADLEAAFNEVEANQDIENEVTMADSHELEGVEEGIPEQYYTPNRTRSSRRRSSIKFDFTEAEKMLEVVDKDGDDEYTPVKNKGKGTRGRAVVKKGAAKKATPSKKKKKN